MSKLKLELNPMELLTDDQIYDLQQKLFQKVNTIINNLDITTITAELSIDVNRLITEIFDNGEVLDHINFDDIGEEMTNLVIRTLKNKS